MATDRAYLNFITEQLPSEALCRPMMGEYVVYFSGRVAGVVCDNCLYVKPVSAAKELMPDACSAPPYAGAKPMLVVENVDDREFLARLLHNMYDELPPPKKKK